MHCNPIVHSVSVISTGISEPNHYHKWSSSSPSTCTLLSMPLRLDTCVLSIWHIHALLYDNGVIVFHMHCCCDNDDNVFLCCTHTPLKPFQRLTLSSHLNSVDFCTVSMATTCGSGPVSAPQGSSRTSQQLTCDQS